MADNNDVNEGQWVDERLQTLSASKTFQPNVARARARLGEFERAASKRARGLWIGAATVCLTLVILPWPRAVAQQLWNRLSLGRVEIVQVPGKNVPESITAALTMEPTEFERHEVADLAEAERLIGFRPSLPPAGVLTGSPRYSVVKRVTLETKPLKIVDIERALVAAGASDIEVPREWEGTTLVAEAGPVLVAEYDGVEVMQSAPFKMSVPAGVNFGRFMEMTFRVFGRSALEAKRLGLTLEANPALIMHFPEHEPVRDVALRSGQGIIVGDPEGPDGICFFWNTSDRIYIVSADNMSERQAVALANSMTTDGQAGGVKSGVRP